MVKVARSCLWFWSLSDRSPQDLSPNGRPWSPGGPSWDSSGEWERGKMGRKNGPSLEAKSPGSGWWEEGGMRKTGTREGESCSAGPNQKQNWVGLWTWRFLHLMLLLTSEMALKSKYVELTSTCLRGRRGRVKREAGSTCFLLDIYCFKMLERGDIFHTWFLLKYKVNPLCIKQQRAFLRVRTLKDSCVLFCFFPSGQWMTSPLTPLTVYVEKLISLLPIKFSCHSEFLIKINILIVCPCLFPCWERS